MRIPKNTIRTQHLRTYGTTGFALEGQAEESGCPRQYRAKYVDFVYKEARSFPLEYGSVMHDALYLAEEEDLPLVPDAAEKAWARSETSLGPDAYTELRADLEGFMERGGLGNLATVAVEQELVAELMEIDGEPYWFGGRLDWLGIDPEDPTTFYFADYKSNRSPPSQADVDADNQFTHYAALVRANLHRYLPGVDPESIRIVGVMAAVKWYDLYTEREHWRMDMYLDWLRAMTRRIVQDETGDPVLNPGCSWCPIKFDCPAFRKLPGKGETLQDRMSRTTDLEQRVYLMQQAQLVIKGLKSVIDEVQNEVKEQAMHASPVTVNGVRYETADDWATDWDVKRLADVLGNEFWSVAGVTAYKVEAIVKRQPELRAGVDAAKQRYPKKTPKLKAVKASPSNGDTIAKELKIAGGK